MTNTPLLSAMRRDFHEQLATMSQQRLEIAEIVNAFAGIIALNGNRPASF